MKMHQNSQIGNTIFFNEYILFSCTDPGLHPFQGKGRLLADPLKRLGDALRVRRPPGEAEGRLSVEIEVHDDAEAVARRGAALLAAAARTATAERGRFLVALSGGSTPWQMLRSLAGMRAEEAPSREAIEQQVRQEVVGRIASGLMELAGGPGEAVELLAGGEARGTPPATTTEAPAGAGDGMAPWIDTDECTRHSPSTV